MKNIMQAFDEVCKNTKNKRKVRKYEDVYIINKDSHHIYYVKGINFDGKWYYTNENDDEIMSGKATAVQMSSYLTALSMKGETIEEITGSA